MSKKSVKLYTDNVLEEFYKPYSTWFTRESSYTSQ